MELYSELKREDFPSLPKQEYACLGQSFSPGLTTSLQLLRRMLGFLKLCLARAKSVTGFKTMV